MKKRLLIFLLAICMVVCNLPVTVMAAKEYSKDNTKENIDPTALEKDDILCVGVTVGSASGYILCFWSEAAQSYSEMLNLNNNPERINANINGATTSTGKWIISNKLKKKGKVYIYLKAYVESTTPTVTFDLNYTGCATAESKNINDDGTVTLPEDPTRNGFEFLGWFTAADDGDEITADKKFTESTTVYAHWAHKHTWAYAASGNTIYAYCTNTYDTCEYSKTNETATTSSLTYKITVAETTEYNDNAASATPTGDNFLTATEQTVPNVTYYTDADCQEEHKTTVSDSGASAIGGAPKNAGNYWVAVTIEGATAKAAFAITKANQTATVSMSNGGYTYGDTPSTPSINGVQEKATPTYYYNTENKNTGGTVWNTSSPPALNVGTYYLYAILPATRNYAAYTTAPAAFNVSAAAMTGISVSGYDNAYDGLEHGITVSAPNYATVKYGYSEGNYTLDTSPTYKNVSATPVDVYYEVTASGYTTVTGHATVTIRRAEITVPDSAVAIAEKTYDGTTAANVSVPATIDGVSGEKITVTGLTGTFDTANAGTERTVTIDSTKATAKVGENDASNYYLTFPTSKKAEIEQREIGLNWGEIALTYTGESQAVTATATNLVKGETVTLTYTGNTATDVDSNYTATVTDISYTDKANTNKNYKLPASTSVSYSISYLTLPNNVDATLSKASGDSGWYTDDAMLTAPGEYVISASGGTGYSWQPSIALSVEGEHTYSYSLRKTDTQGITDTMTKTVKIDRTNPTGEIKIKENSFKTLLNTITFKYFFKNNIDVTITGSDAVSGVAKIEYQKVAKDATYKANGTWTPLTNTATTNTATSGKFSVPVNDKSVYYARITDNAGRSIVINSDGVVVYTDAASEGNEITYTLTTKTDTATGVALNGNTVAAVRNGELPLDTGDYRTDNGKLVLDGDYLEKLSAGQYAITVSYNPYGEKFTNGTSIGDAPQTTTINLTVKKAEQTVNVTETTLTYGAENALPAVVGVQGEANYTLYYYAANETASNAKPLTSTASLPAGTYHVYAVVDGTENYESKTTAPVTLTVEPAVQSAPPAPTLKSRTKHEIVLNTLPDNAESGNAVQYSIDGGKTWQDSPRFENLSTETSYTFSARYKGSGNYKASGQNTAAISTVSRSGIAYGTVHIYAGEHGNATPSGSLMVRDGDDMTINFTPDVGYEVADVVVNHRSVGAVSAYTVKNVNGNMNVEVTFVKTGNAVVSTGTGTNNPATGA